MTWTNREAATEMNPEPHTLCRLVVAPEDKETNLGCYRWISYLNLLSAEDFGPITDSMSV